MDNPAQDFRERILQKYDTPKKVADYLRDTLDNDVLITNKGISYLEKFDSLRVSVETAIILLNNIDDKDHSS